MDEDRLRGLLHLATATEPPIGSLARDALLAGIRLRRRRRLQSAAGCFATAAVLGAAVPALTGGFNGPARPFASGRAASPPAAAGGLHCLAAGSSVVASKRSVTRATSRWKIWLRITAVSTPPCGTAGPPATWAQAEKCRHLHMTGP